MRKFFKPAVAIVLFAVVAASYVYPIPFSILQKWGFLIFFAIFCAYMGWYIFSQDKEIRESRKAKPLIKAAIEHNLDDYSIKVLNKGGKARFKSRIELITDDPNIRRYKSYVGCWQKSTTEESEIFHDDWDFIRIASLANDMATYTSHYELYMLDVKSGHQSSVGGQRWSPLMKLIGVDGTEREMAKPTYNIRVKVVTEPGLNTEFVKEYSLDMDKGLLEITK
jgi:hypothetical protein